MRYRADIDGLRALAVIPVVAYHAGFNTFSGGFVGVDVFFVISGYLITRLLMEEQDAGAGYPSSDSTSGGSGASFPRSLPLSLFAYGQRWRFSTRKT